MSSPTPSTYWIRSWPAWVEALKRRGWLAIRFTPVMSRGAVQTGRRGRQQTYCDTARQTCLTMKVLFGLALRQATGFIRSLLQLVSLDWTCPTSAHYRGFEGPQHLLIETTGGHVGDASILPDLLEQIPEDQESGCVMADGAYSTRTRHGAIANRGVPAVIPHRTDVKPWKTAPTCAITDLSDGPSSRRLQR